MKDKAIKDAMNSIENRIRHVYNQGYNDGVNYGIEIGRDFEKAGEYGCGLEDAWECARKIMLSDEDGGIAHIDIQKIFSMSYYSVMLNYSASEAIAKIKEYEEKQKRTCDTCQYKGGTLHNLKECANCYNNSGWTPKQTKQCCESKKALDEAIKHCEEVADTPCFTDEEAKCYSEHRQLAEWLKELKAYKAEGSWQKSDWIPCSKRLPNKDKYTDFYKCLVAVRCTSHNDICDTFTAYFDGRHFYRHLYDAVFISGVEAWMPLPEQYKIEPQESEE